MNPRMIAGFLALVCGVTAAYLTFTLNKNKNKGPEMVEVLWSKSKVPLREKITDPEKYFVIRPVAKGSFPPKALTSFEQLKDKRLNKTISEENYVTSDDLLGLNQQFLEPEIGKRLFGLTVNAESLAGGFIRPGSFVDLIGTKRLPNGNVEALTIMQNVRVMAVGDKTTLLGDDRHTLVENTVTLEVTPDQSQVLSMWKSVGEIKLSARAIGDKDTTVTKGIRLNPEEIKNLVPEPAKTIVEAKKGDTEVAVAPRKDIQSHTMFIIDVKDAKSGSSGAESIEFVQDKNGKWHTRFRQDRGTSTASSKEEAAPAPVEPEKTKETKDPKGS